MRLKKIEKRRRKYIEEFDGKCLCIDGKRYRKNGGDENLYSEVNNKYMEIAARVW